MTSQPLMHRLELRDGIFSRAGSVCVQTLHNVADQVQAGIHWSAVILDTQGDVRQTTAAYLSELTEGLQFEELVERIVMFRELLRKIQSSSIPWIFLADGDVTGSVAELCFCCHARYFQSGQAMIGFPELEIDAFPPGGWFEREIFRKKAGSKHDWRARTTIDARKAEELGLIHGVLAVESLTDYVFHHWDILHADLKGMRSSATKGPLGEGATASVNSNLANPPVKQMLAEDSLWVNVSQIFRDSEGKRAQGQLDTIIASMVARFFFSERQLVWHRKQSAATAATMSAPHRHSSTFICVDQLAPPVAALSQLLESGMSIVFYADEMETLKRHLDVAFARLERRLGAIEAQQRWVKQISWFIGSAPKFLRVPVLSWDVSEVCRLSGGGLTFDVHFHRLSGNRIGSDLGCAEVVLKDSEAQTFLETSGRVIAMCIAEQVVVTSGWMSQGVPISTIVRSLVFCEMLRLRDSWGVELSEFAQILREEGWGFIGDEERWERFLRFRPQIDYLDLREAGQGLPIDEVGVSMASLRELRHISLPERNRSFSDLGRGFWSQHFQLMLTLLVLQLGRQIPSPSRDRLELLITQSVGWPRELLWPSDYISRAGLNAAQRYLQDHWPEWRSLERIHT